MCQHTWTRLVVCKTLLDLKWRKYTTVWGKSESGFGGCSFIISTLGLKKNYHKSREAVCYSSCLLFCGCGLWMGFYFYFSSLIFSWALWEESEVRNRVKGWCKKIFRIQSMLSNWEETPGTWTAGSRRTLDCKAKSNISEVIKGSQDISNRRPSGISGVGFCVHLDRSGQILYFIEHHFISGHFPFL